MCLIQVYICEAQKARWCPRHWEASCKRCKNRDKGCRIVRMMRLHHFCSHCKRMFEKEMKERRRWDLKKLLDHLTTEKNDGSVPAASASVGRIGVERDLTMTLAIRSKQLTRNADRDAGRAEQRFLDRDRSCSPQRNRAQVDTRSDTQNTSGVLLDKSTSLAQKVQQIQEHGILKGSVSGDGHSKVKGQTSTRSTHSKQDKTSGTRGIINTEANRQIATQPIQNGQGGDNGASGKVHARAVTQTLTKAIQNDQGVAKEASGTYLVRCGVHQANK